MSQESGVSYSNFIRIMTIGPLTRLHLENASHLIIIKLSNESILHLTVFGEVLNGGATGIDLLTVTIDTGKPFLATAVLLFQENEKCALAEGAGRWRLNVKIPFLLVYVLLNYISTT